jgi:hypothetical protein
MNEGTNIVAFLDNSENRIVIEMDAEWAEEKFMYENGQVWTGKLFTHIGLDISWQVKKVEYTGDTYIVTFTKLWV